MKSEKTFFGVNCKDEEVNLTREHYLAYAQYFVKFIEEYQKHNISIDLITVQNEPQNKNAKSHPGMCMGWNEQAEFIKNHLGPAFENASINTKILIWDHNWDNKDFAENLFRYLNESGGIKYVSGSAWHGYEGNAKTQTDIYNNWTKDIYFTEMSPSGNYSFGTNLNYSYGYTFLPALSNYAKTVILWNIALNDKFGPREGGDCSNCRGLVNFSQNLSGYGFEAEYYLMGHFSRFIDPGAIRIDAKSKDVEIRTVAFRNNGTDNSSVLIAFNANDKTEKEFQVQWKDKHFNYSLGNWSIVTFKWKEEENT